MILVSTLYQRFRTLIHEGSKFLVIGGIGFVVTEVGFNLFRFSAGLGLFTSNALATVIATIVTFVGNRYWTFRHRQGHGTTRESVIFVVLNAVGLLIQYGAIWVAQNILGFPHDDKFSTNVALLIGIGIATLFRFWSYRKWVWHTSAAGPAVPAVQTSPTGPSAGGYEMIEPALVPPDRAVGHGPGGTNGSSSLNGYGLNGSGLNGSGREANGRTRSDGPRHARS